MASKKSPPSGTVYSTEQGRTCPDCCNPTAACSCSAERPALSSDGVVRIRRETKGRNGKCVTVITGIPLASPELTALVKRLKTKCGSGGTIKDGTVEIQGDHCETLSAELKSRGWTVKRAGG